MADKINYTTANFIIYAAFLGLLGELTLGRTGYMGADKAAPLLPTLALGKNCTRKERLRDLNIPPGLGGFLTEHHAMKAYWGVEV